MPIRLLVFVAWRGLLQSRLITLLLCIAIAGGVAFQIPIDANLHGYRREIIAQGIVSGFGDVRVRPRSSARFEDADALATRLANQDGVVAAVPVIQLPGAVGVNGNFKHALVMAVDASAPVMPFAVLEGQSVPAGDGFSIVVGTALARRAGVEVGDDVQLRIVFGGAWNGTQLDDDLGRYTMKVRGLATGSFLAPESIFIDRRFMRDELSEPHSASVIFVHLADHAAARAIAARIERELPDVSAAAWNDDSPFLSSALGASSAIGLVSRAMVALAVLIPVWALLYVHVLHRERQIGVMGAIGLRRLEVFAVYLMHAAIVGAVGVTIGGAVGFALIRWFDSHPIFESAGFVIRPDVRVDTFAIPALLVFATTLVAGVFPAWRASRTDPARILRGNA